MTQFVPFLAYHHIRRRPLQSSLTMLGVAIGVMALLTALSLTNGFIDDLIDSTLIATPHLSVHSISQRYIADEPEGLPAQILAHPEVVSVAPYLEHQGIIARRANAQQGIQGRSSFVQLLGIDPAKHQEILPNLTDLHQHLQMIEQDNGIVLGSGLAQSLFVFPGDEVIISDIDGRRARYTVAGIFDAGNYMIDNVTAYLSLPNLRQLMRLEGPQIRGYHVRLQHPENSEQVKQDLWRVLPISISSWQNLFGRLIEQMKFQKRIITIVLFLIVLVAAVGIANVLILTVAEKTQEIAVLRALGASQRQIVLLFTTESFFLGSAGTLLGTVLGLALSWYFKWRPLRVPPEINFIGKLSSKLQPIDFIWVCALTIVISVLAGVIPARRASRLEPAEILR